MYDNSSSRRDGRSGGNDRGGGRGGERGGDRGERRGVPLSELDPALTAVSHKVIGAARDVHMTMGQGFDKQVYLDALKHELTSQGVAFEQNATFKPSFKGQAVGSVTTDLFVDRKFLVEVMATPEEVASWDRLRLRAKLKAADLELGLILNFGHRLMKDGLVRVLNPDKIKSLQGGDDEAGGGGGEGDA